MIYLRNKEKYMCLNACDNWSKQRDVNPLLWMQVNEDGKNGIINMEIYMTSFPRLISTKD